MPQFEYERSPLTPEERKVYPPRDQRTKEGLRELAKQGVIDFVEPTIATRVAKALLPDRIFRKFRSGLSAIGLRNPLDPDSYIVGKNDRTNVFHLISEGTRIDGGLYPGSILRENEGREILSVKFDESQFLPALYTEVITKSIEEGGSTEENILNEVFTSLRTLQDTSGGEDEAAQLNNSKGIDGQTVMDLDFYFENNVFECRHLALIGGAVIERAISENHLSGKVSIQRGEMYEGNALTGHVWIVFTNGKGTRIIIDGSIGYMATESEYMAAMKRGETLPFDYLQ